MRRKWRQVRRSTAYLLWLVLSSFVGVVLLFVLVVFIVSTFVPGLGLVTPLLLAVVIRRWTDLHRGLAGWVLGEHIARRYRPLRGGLGARLRQVVTDRTTWRDLGWLVANSFAGLVAGVIGLFFAGGPLVTLFSMFFWWSKSEGDPLQMLATIQLTDWPTAIGVGLATLIVLVPLGFFVVPPVARLHARMTRALLGRSSAEELARRVETLTETRAGVIDAHGAELRRIERDLHDGTQARLVSIAMRLGVAKQALAHDPDAAARLIDDARAGAEDAMGELRTILRTMYPPILADRGLSGAINALAAQAGVPTTVSIDDLGEVPAPVEAAAYFTIAEALTNIAKHSGASAATVGVRRSHTQLIAAITDNGTGGVDETRGSGIAGIRRRVAALDGTIGVVSPRGGPTTITVELPCGS